MYAVPRSGPTPNITRLSDTAVAVSWRPLTLEEARGFIIGYTVTAEPRDDRQRQVETLSVMVGPNKNMATIQGLVPSQEYWVTVAASTTAGTSTNNMGVYVGALSQGSNNVSRHSSSSSSCSSNSCNRSSINSSSSSSSSSCCCCNGSCLIHTITCSAYSDGNMTITIIAVVVCCVLISLLILILIIFISICW